MHTFQSDNESLAKRALKFTIVVGMHAAVLTWLLHAQFRTLSEPVPVRMDVRTIEVPPPAPPKPVIEPPKPPPRTPRPVVQRPEPVAPVTPPPVLTAAPSADPAPAAFTVPPQPPAPHQQEAPPPPPPPAPVPVTEARFDAAYLQNPAPANPPLSRRLREEGKVLLLVRVTAGGSAENVQIKQSSGFPRLDEAALGAVRQWRFVPARRGAEAIAANVMVPIVFRLE